MFGTPSTANKKRGSVGTLTTAESSTLIPTNSLFGSQPAASSTPSFGQPANPLSSGTSSSLFGTPAATSTTITPAPTNSLFGIKPTTTTPTNSLFGAQTTTPSAFGSQPNSLFQNAQNTQLTQNNQQQQQQQDTSYLSLDTCFPDKKVPYFIVTPDRIARTTVPANFFHGNTTRESYNSNVKSELNNGEPLSTSGFNERVSTLPNYLISVDNTSSVSIIINKKTNVITILLKLNIRLRQKTNHQIAHPIKREVLKMKKWGKMYILDETKKKRSSCFTFIWIDPTVY